MIRVLATREGLIGGKTSTGWKINTVVPFVALPAFAALRQWVRVRNVKAWNEPDPKKWVVALALVMDVGPWNIDDDAYVFQAATMPGNFFTHQPDKSVRPQAESGTDKTGRKTNGAGIDLGERVWQLLGMTDNSEVEWEFV